MTEFNASVLESVTKGKRMGSGKEASFLRVSTDSRTVQQGDLFIALKGDQFNGHDFLGDAILKGALGAVISDPQQVPADPGESLFFVVEDTLKALQDLARHHRKTINPKVLAITGSNGKTTVKEMVGAILSRQFRTLISHANFNNHIGVPLNLLRLKKGDEWAVLEFGMSAPGEIDALCRIAEPNWGLITNITEAHTEFFSSIEEVRKAKGELVDYLGPDSVMFLNSDDPGSMTLRQSVRGKLITFGVQTRSDTIAESITENGRLGHSFVIRHGFHRIPMHISIPGRHNVENAASAAAVAFEAGCLEEEIVHGLSTLLPLPMRMEAITLQGPVILFNDSYNANPASTMAAIDAMARFRKGGRCFLAVGDMLELGDYSKTGHKLVGKRAAEARLDGLVTMGDQAKLIAEEARRSGLSQESIQICSNHEEAAEWILRRLKENDLVLVKGSRNSRMDLVAEELIRSRGKG